MDNQESGNKSELKRSLKSRHIQMIAIGGSVGVGIFKASSKMIQLSGPSVLLAYAIVGVFVYFILRSLGEMAVHHPVSGSFSTYANDYLGNYMGYLTGWSYWFLWAAGVMAEITAVGTYMKFWFGESVPAWVWALASLVLLTTINLINVKAFGEIEFWFSIIKVVTILALILTGFAIIVYAKFSNAFPEVGFFNLWQHGGFFPKGVVSTLMAVGPVSVAFIGVESIGLTAGEAENPSKTLPKAINSVLFRVLLFYIGSILVIMSLFPWNQMDPEESPFVLTFNKIGLKSAASIINFVVLTAALSACNSGIFSSSRMAYTLQSQKNAPRILGQLNSKQIPVFAVLFSFCFMLVGVLLSFMFPKDAFDLVFGMAGIAGFFIWAVIIITQLKFRKSLSEQQVTDLKCKSFIFPMINYLTLFFIAFAVFSCCFSNNFRISMFIFIGWVAVLTVFYIMKSFWQKRVED